jgi:NADH dehydrogenase (ubiquinone) 1 alpha subcomplex subunit 9
LAVASIRSYVEVPGIGHLSRGIPKIVPTGKSPNVSGVVATVFGSTGFVGRYVVSALGEQGSQVVIPYRGTENTFRHLKVLGDLGQIVPMECDVWKPEQIEVGSFFFFFFAVVLFNFEYFFICFRPVV